MRETEEQLEVATEAASVGLWTWDIRENVVTADEYLAGSYGMDSEAVATGAPMEAFYVTDDGVGIPPDERETVFEAGYTTTAGQGGTGLGLAFVRELADVYDWTCEVTESAAGGARFEFTNIDRGGGGPE